MVEYNRRLFEGAFANRIPLTVTVELTERCNFRCVHCYLEGEKRNKALDCESVIKFVDQVVSKGCIYVTLTGGEATMHPDFIEIYTYLVKRGCCVTVMTNASGLTEDMFLLFEKFPPRRVEVTLYGFSEETYQIVTGAKMFERTKEAVLRLKRQGTPLLQKMFVVKENICDYYSVANFAVSNNIPFKYDSIILAKSDSPQMKHQIEIEGIKWLEEQRMAVNNDSDELWVRFVSALTEGKIFQCSAGRSTCWLKADGWLQMCNFLRNPRVDMSRHTFQEAWDVFSKVIQEDVSPDVSCNQCKLRIYCDVCPAKLSTINGDAGIANCYEKFRCLAEWRMMQEGGA